MRINDPKTIELLPDFAHNIDWVCNALDLVLASIRRKSDAIDAPLTMASIEALSDDEIQYYFDSLGFVKYYPDIPRALQNKILYNASRLQHALGTPRAVELMCQYVFEDIDLRIELSDNLAFDDQGNLTDSALLDLFDVKILPSSNDLGENTIYRLYDNIFSTARNSQTIRELYVEYDTDVSFKCAPALPCDGIVSVRNINNFDICVEAPRIPIWIGGDFNGNDIKAKDVGGGGGNVRKYASYKALEELQGWSPGGSFTQYEIIGDIITATSDSSIIISSDDFGGIVR